MQVADFSALVGNSHIKHYLTRMIQQKTIANSLLFAGPSGIGKSLFAQAFAAELLGQDDPEGYHRRKVVEGNHPDLRHYRPEGKLSLHSMESLRQLSAEVYMPPFEASWKVFIIHEADRMWSYSANALLKTFEEPPPRTVIILLSSAPSSLLPTVMSRCRALYFQPLTPHEIKDHLKKKVDLDETKLKTIARLAEGSLSRALELVEEGGGRKRKLLLDFLARGEAGTYKALTNLVGLVAEEIEAAKKEVEDTAKEEWSKVHLDNLSAQQQHHLEKELDGFVAMRFQQDVFALFGFLLSWYRDLHLLHVRGNPEFLVNADYQSELEQAIQRGTILPMEKVQSAFNEARLALERSTPFSLCLENLLLKLNL